MSSWLALQLSRLPTSPKLSQSKSEKQVNSEICEKRDTGKRRW